MKFFEIDEEYLKKGGLITREIYENGLSFGLYCNCLVAYQYGEVKLPIVKFIGYKNDLLADDWKYVEYNKKWKPQYGEKYYTISTRGTIDFDNFVSGNNTDANRLLLGNVFETEEEAKKMVVKLKIINRLRELSNIKFVYDTSKLRYSIGYDIDTKKVVPTMNRFTRIIPFDLYFETAKDCQNAINEIGEENLKKYYFDVVD